MCFFLFSGFELYDQILEVCFVFTRSFSLSFFLFILCTSEMTRLKNKKSIIKSLISRLSPLQVLTKHILDLEKV